MWTSIEWCKTKRETGLFFPSKNQGDFYPREGRNERFFPKKNQSYFCPQKRGGMSARSKQVFSEAYSSGEWSMVQPSLPPTSHFLTEEERRNIYISFFMLFLSESASSSINCTIVDSFSHLGNLGMMAGSLLAFLTTISAEELPVMLTIITVE